MKSLPSVFISATNDFRSFLIRHSLFVIPTLLCCHLSACSSLFKNSAEEAVVYALGSRDGFTSPLNANLKPACPALVFDSEGIALTPAHEHAIRTLAQELEQNKKARLLVAGYTPPNLPQDHARSLSERRALAVRQRLIELGREPANLQTVGFGNDFAPSSPSSGVVVIYQQN